MARVSKVLLSNLPFGISEDRLRQEVLVAFAEEIPKPEAMFLTVFRPQPKRQLALMSGISGNLRRMALKGKKHFIEGRNICVKEDLGGERDERGEYVHILSPVEVRRLQYTQTGESHRKVKAIFADSFLRQIQPEVFNFNERNFCINKIDVPESTLQLAGELEYFRPSQPHRSTRVRYCTGLECLQAIRYFNRNPSYGNFRITSEDKEVLATICENKGLASRTKLTGFRTGTLLRVMDYADSHHDVIPFELLDFAILDHHWIQSVKSFCWKCKSPYELFGIQVDLNYVAGECNCSYSQTRDVTDPARGYFWPSESFTRLILGQQSSGKYTSLVISHYPFKDQYESFKEYRQIVFPVLQEEFRYCSEETEKSSRSDGHVSFVHYVENDEDGNDIYIVQIDVTKSQFWCVENSLSVKRVTAELTFQKLGRFTREKRNGKVRRFMDKNNNEVSLYIQIRCSVGSSPLSNMTTGICASFDDTEYRSTRKIINDVFEKEDKAGVLRNLFIGTVKKSDFQLSIMEERRPSVQDVTDGLKKMTATLNKEQKYALSNAKAYTASFIHGPPGCGKTYTLSCIVANSAATETGLVIATAPSNVAADGLALAVGKLNESFGLGLKVLRIYSQKRQSRFLFQESTARSEYDTLHEKVRAELEAIDDELVQGLVKAVKSGDDFLFTAAQRSQWDAVLRNLETEIFKKYHIVVCTLGSLSDKRVESWTMASRIGAVLLDEAGQVPNPVTLALCNLKCTKIVISGDPNQLRPNVSSYSAQVAGLDMSLIEICRRRCNSVPWVMLLEQHRMNPSIREIVSYTFYANKLRDAASVITRNHPPYDFVNFPEIQTSAVAFFHHEGLEERMGTSYQNVTESELVISILQRLLKSGVQPSNCVVLTLYESQRQLILETLSTCDQLRNAQEIRVNNVDAFQGDEKDFVVLSLVRSNSRKDLGFISDEHRLNVALSRAKLKLMIAGNFNMLKNHGSHVCNKLAECLKKYIH